MVFQRPTPFPGSVADNLAVARPDAGTGELGTALERVALDPGLLGQEPRTLSGGELTAMGSGRGCAGARRGRGGRRGGPRGH